MAFRIAINAGHYRGTPGKRCAKAFDPEETREWVLNNRVVSLVIKGLEAYGGYELRRVDDPTGLYDVSLRERTDRANAFGADIYLSVHHNAGGGSGIEVYTYLNVGAQTLAYQKLVYDCLIEATGNKGNRARPLRQEDLFEVRETKMPAVLCECGYMDNAEDTPRILSDAYAEKLAKGLVNALVRQGGLARTAPSAESSDSAVTNGASGNASGFVCVGDMVRFKGGPVFLSSTDAAASSVREASSCLVTILAENAPHPVHLISQDGKQVYGWVNADAVDGLAAVTPVTPPASGGFAVGDRVRVKPSAVYYAESRVKIPDYVKGWTVYVRQAASGKALVSPYLTGDITGWVALTDLISAG